MKKNLIITVLILLTTSLLAAPEQSLDKELTALAEKLVTAATNANVKKIATLDFTDLQGNPSELGRFIAEQVAVTLVMSKRTFAVVDRANLKRILDEHKLSMSGLVNPENTKKLGQFSGVDAIILGRITPMADSVAISATITLTETAEVVGGAKSRISKSQDVLQLIDRSVAVDSTGITTAQPGQASTNNAQLDLTKLLKIEKNSLQVDDLFIKVESLRYTENVSYGYYGNLTATLVMVNTNLASEIGVVFDDTDFVSIATNSRGDEFKSVRGNQIGISSAHGGENNLLNNITGIPPGKSIKVVVKYAEQFSDKGKLGNFAPYRLQFVIYMGKEVQDRFTIVKNHNVLIDVDVAK